MAGLLGTISGRVTLDTRQAVAAYAALRAQNARTVYALRNSGDAFVRTGQVMGAAGAGLIYMFGKAVLAAAEFERKMDFFAAVTDTNAAKMQKLSEYTLQLAQDTIYSADQIAEGFIELGKAGVSAEGIMDGIGRAMANLGAAGDIPLAESGQIITSTIQQYDLAARDAVAVTDLLAGAANASIADITDIGVSLKYVGGVANAAGLDFEDTATAISLLAKAGIRGSTAGTSLRQMIVSFGGATGPARESLRELGILTGKNSNLFYDQEGNLKSLSKVFQILQTHTEGLTAKQRLMHLRTIFNNRALSAASILTREGADGFREMNKEMGKTTAADVAAERLDNLSGDIEILRGNIETMMITAGSPFQEMLRTWVKRLTKLVQAFNELDPETQKNITSFVGIAGVALLAMGAFNILIGITLKFIAHMLNLGAAFGFVNRSVGKAGTAVGKFGKLLRIGGIVGLVIGFLYAIAKAFDWLATKNERFSRMWSAFKDNFQAGWAVPAWVALFKQWFREVDELLNGFPSKVADKLGKAASKVEQFARDFPENFKVGVEAAPGLMESMVDKSINFLKRLPGNAKRLAGLVVSAIINFFQQLPGRVSGFIGSMVDRAGQLLTSMGNRLGSLAGSARDKVVNALQALPGQVGYLIGFMIGRAVRLLINFSIKAGAAARTVVNKVVNFFQALPGRVAAFFTRLVTRAIGYLRYLKEEGPRIAAETATGIVQFLRDLPENVARLFVQMVSKARQKLNEMFHTAVDMATRISTAIVNGLVNLPSVLAGIVGDMIDAFLDKIQGAYEAARDFAGGLWKGFKDGLGMNSPSYPERAMWQITGTMDKETKKLAKKTMEIQKIARNMAATKFSIPDTYASGTGQFGRLARDQMRNRERSRRFLNVSERRPRALARAGGGGPKGPLDIEGTLELRNGRAYIRGIAQDVVDENDGFDDDHDRMG